MFIRFAMASANGSGGGGGGSGMFGRDVAWKYCSPVEGNQNVTICNFCGLLMKSGGISRFKYHLEHRDPNNNTKKCPIMPPEVKEEIQEMILKKVKKKQRKLHILKRFGPNYVALWGPGIHMSSMRMMMKMKKCTCIQ